MHAKGFTTGELEHWPVELVDDDQPSNLAKSVAIE